MTVQTRPNRWLSNRRASKYGGAQDNRLSFMDQAGLALLRATGRGQLMQCVWIYEHPVDFDALRRFHRNFGYGLAGRRIERSPLPFGRHRWVSAFGPQSDMDVVEGPRARAELSDWLDERAQLPVDPETGPGWHLGVLPMTDGSTGISLVGSHCLGDGVAALITVVEAVLGARRDLGYPPPRSRKRFRGALSDLRDTAKSTPEVARTVVAAGKLAVRQRREMAASGPMSAVDGDTAVVLPAISIFVDLPQWDARADSLNGNSYSLLAGFAAKLAERVGRRRADGAVTLHIALNDRTGLDDTRAQAMLFAQAALDPTRAATDLTDARIAIRHALKAAREIPDETLQLLPLVPLVPKRALRRVAEMFFGSGDDRPVSCSNLGDIDPAVGRPDGTDAEYVMLRGVDQNVRRADVEKAGGQLVVVAGRIGGKMSISVVAYQPGGENAKPNLRAVAAHSLAEFQLTGEIV
ncbi:MAG TPA: hypothetical protein VHI10_01870 [Mycobacterium sp.]|nr:hypothetical protein [Mycobacterium sp.]